jgi:hypothetical protein
MASIIEGRSVQRIKKGISGPAVLLYHVHGMKGLNNTLGFIPCSTHLMDGSYRKARATLSIAAPVLDRTVWTGPNPPKNSLFLMGRMKQGKGQAGELKACFPDGPLLNKEGPAPTKTDLSPT